MKAVNKKIDEKVSLMFSPSKRIKEKFIKPKLKTMDTRIVPSVPRGFLFLANAIKTV